MLGSAISASVPQGLKDFKPCRDEAALEDVGLSLSWTTYLSFGEKLFVIKNQSFMVSVGANL
jgi:hypothetical protein